MRSKMEHYKRSAAELETDMAKPIQCLQHTLRKLPILQNTTENTIYKPKNIRQRKREKQHITKSVIYVKKQMKLSFTFFTNVTTEKKYGTLLNP